MAIGATVSAYFVLAANSWMQQPAGFHYHPAAHRAELSSFAALLGNPTLLAACPQTLVAGFLTAGGLVTGVAGWQLVRGRDVRACARAVASRTGAVALVFAAGFLRRTQVSYGSVVRAFLLLWPRWRWPWQ